MTATHRPAILTCVCLCRRGTRDGIPPGVNLAALWAERALVLGAATWLGTLLLWRLALVVVPLVVAVLLAALLTPVVQRLAQFGVPRSAAALGVLVVAAASCAALLATAVRQVVSSGDDLSAEVASALERIRVWLQDGPLQISDSQIDTTFASAQSAVTSSNDRIVHGLAAVTATVGHVAAGAFISLFATYFILADGSRIWAWLLRLLPRSAQERAQSSGQVAWVTLTAYVRGSIVVAVADALGILIIAAVLDLPFLFTITVLVFVGAFVPIVGAFGSGMVAVMVALVDQGPFMALLMLVGVVAVQQVEAHVLQPFVLGRLVALHPLGVFLAIAAGALLAGVVGALVAVPLVAVLNSVVTHLARPSPLADVTDEPGHPSTGPAEVPPAGSSPVGT